MSYNPDKVLPFKVGGDPPGGCVRRYKGNGRPAEAALVNRAPVISGTLEPGPPIKQGKPCNLLDLISPPKHSTTSTSTKAPTTSEPPRSAIRTANFFKECDVDQKMSPPSTVPSTGTTAQSQEILDESDAQEILDDIEKFNNTKSDLELYAIIHCIAERDRARNRNQ